MVSSNKVYFHRKSHLKGDKVQRHLTRKNASVDVVSQEQVLPFRRLFLVAFHVSPKVVVVVGRQLRAETEHTAGFTRAASEESGRHVVLYVVFLCSLFWRERVRVSQKTCSSRYTHETEALPAMKIRNYVVRMPYDKYLIVIGTIVSRTIDARIYQPGMSGRSLSVVKAKKKRKKKIVECKLLRVALESIGDDNRRTKKKIRHRDRRFQIKQRRFYVARSPLPSLSRTEIKQCKTQARHTSSPPVLVVFYHLAQLGQNG